nr:hypothetical protein 1634Bnrm3_p101 [Cryptomonas sp.]
MIRHRTSKKMVENQINCSFANHFHIRGIGINNIFSCKNICQGFVGKIHIRKAAAIFLQSIKSFEVEKLNIVITGNFGTGKTSLCIAISLSIEKCIPFTAISGAEFSFPGISKIENIIQSVRKTIGIRFYNESLIIEGEVIDIQVNESKQKKYKTYVKLILKTNEIQTTYKISEEIYSKILQKMIKKGDIVLINKEKNSIEKKGSIFTINNSENTNNEFRKTRKGDLERYEIHENIVTMFELDILNSFSEFPLSKLFIENVKEISNEIREKIDRIVIRWEKNKKIKIIKGILLFDDANMLDIECFSFLSKNIESVLSPVFILSTNNSTLKINGIGFSSPHGIPVDVIDRFLVIQTSPHSYCELRKILSSKADDDLLYLDENAKELLTKIGIECGIRYSIYIMSIASLISQNKYIPICAKEIKQSFLLFVDSKRFIRYTKKIKKNISNKKINNFQHQLNLKEN